MPHARPRRRLPRAGARPRGIDSAIPTTAAQPPANETASEQRGRARPPGAVFSHEANSSAHQRANQQRTTRPREAARRRFQPRGERATNQATKSARCRFQSGGRRCRIVAPLGQQTEIRLRPTRRARQGMWARLQGGGSSSRKITQELFHSLLDNEEPSFVLSLRSRTVSVMPSVLASEVLAEPPTGPHNVPLPPP